MWSAVQESSAAEKIEGWIACLSPRHGTAALIRHHRDDGVELADTHDRIFIIAPDGLIHAIDVQPHLKPGFDFDSVKPLI